MSVVVSVRPGAATLEDQARALIERNLGDVADLALRDDMDSVRDAVREDLKSGDVAELANTLSELVYLRNLAGFCMGCGEVLGIDEHLTGCERPASSNRLPPPPSLAVPDAARAAKGSRFEGDDERSNPSHERLTEGNCRACGRWYCAVPECPVCPRERARCAVLSGSEQCVSCEVVS